MKEGWTDPAMTIQGKRYKQDGQSEAMALCIEDQMPASTLSLETPLACSGARTSLFLPHNCYSCPQTQGKTGLGALQTPFSSRFLNQEDGLLCGLLFKSETWRK